MIDTPGVRSFGLAHITADDIVAAFEEFAEAAEECPAGCGHLGPPENPDCMLDEVPDKQRLPSLRRLLASRGGLEV